LLQSHGKIDECINFAEKVKASQNFNFKQNYDTVIIHYINKQEYKKAIEKISEIQKGDEKVNLMLRYVSVLMKKQPSNIVYKNLKS
jgi:hypothetical protein